MLKCRNCKKWFSETNAEGGYFEKPLKPELTHSDLSQSWRGECPFCFKKISIYVGRIPYMHDEDNDSDLQRLKELREGAEWGE